MAEHQSVFSRLQRKLPPYLLARPGSSLRLPADSSVPRQHRAAPSERRLPSTAAAAFAVMGTAWDRPQ